MIAVVLERRVDVHLRRIAVRLDDRIDACAAESMSAFMTGGDLRRVGALPDTFALASSVLQLARRSPSCMLA